MNVLTMTLLISGIVVFLAVSVDVVGRYLKDRKFKRAVARLYREHRAKWDLHVHLPASKHHGNHRKAGV